MKKLLLTLFLAVASLSSFAQYYYNDYKPLSFIIRGGVTFSNLVQSADGIPGTGVSSKLTYFNVGGFADLRFNEMLSFQPGVMITGKGGRQFTELSVGIDINNGNTNTQAFLTDAKTTITYVQVPLTLVFHAEANDYDDLFVGGGPFVAYALMGKVKGTRTSLTDESAVESFKQDVSFGSGAGQLKRLDYGLTGMLGYKLDNGFMINASYDFGLSNLTPNIAEDEFNAGQTKTRALSVSIGYLF